MKIKVIILILLGMASAVNVCLAQSREPNIGSESPSTGVSSVDSPADTSSGYDSGNHGNVS